MDANKPSNPQQVPTLTEVVEVAEVEDTSEAALPELANVLIDLSEDAMALTGAPVSAPTQQTQPHDLVIEAAVDEVLLRISTDAQFRSRLDQAIAQAVQQATNVVLAEFRERLVSDLQARLSPGPNVRPAP